MLMPLLIYLLTSVVFASFTLFVAKEKNRNQLDWFLLGLLFHIVAMLALIALPVLPSREPTVILPTNIDQKPDFCHYCGGSIQEGAETCPSCQKRLSDVTEQDNYGGRSLMDFR